MDDNEISDIEIRKISNWPAEEIVELYKSGGWWREHFDPSGIPALIKGSFVFVIALNKNSGQAIGMGRAVSDGVSDAYIQDIVVMQPFRRKGIGLRITREILEFCLEKGLQWIGLVAEPGTKKFYEPLGFKTLPGEPMVYQPEE